MSWKDCKLGDVFEINPPRSIKKGEMTPFVPMDILPTHSRHFTIAKERAFKGSGQRFKNGDTLLARITPCLENGKTAYVRGLSDEQIAHGSTEFIVICGKKNISDNLFAYYIARMSSFRSYCIGRMEGTSGRQRVPVSAVSDYIFQLPPLNEQRAIASVLGALDEKIENNRAMNETLEEMARAIFKSWFVDFDPVHAKSRGEQPAHMDAETAALFPDRFGDDGLPEGWREGDLGEIAENPKRSVKLLDVKEGTLYIGLEHMPRRSIALTDWEASEKVSSNKSAFKMSTVEQN